MKQLILTLATIFMLISCKKVQTQPCIQPIVESCNKQVTYRLSITSTPFIPNNITYNNCCVVIAHGDLLNTNGEFVSYKYNNTLTPTTGGLDSLSYTFNLSQKEGYTFGLSNNTFNPTYIPLNVKLFKDNKLIYNAVINPIGFILLVTRKSNTCQDSIYTQ